MKNVIITGATGMVGGIVGAAKPILENKDIIKFIEN
jgi:hypothetical protein